ncbi:MAG TPA: hypothetical protein VLE73_00325 [Candidatus Saccharimonadales bacterium]|nr:hypothetical protein [Candidatus Saccharimonadales bacterium]
MSSEESEKSKTLRIALDELRRVHEHVSKAYDQLRTKALAMIAGEVAIITFLFSGDKDTRIGMPEDIASRLFLFAGLLALAAAFCLLIRSIASDGWYIPGDMDEIEQIDNGKDNRYDTSEKFLLFLKKDYLESTRDCIKILNRKGKWVNWGLYLLLGGIIILVVIKYGGIHT